MHNPWLIPVVVVLAPVVLLAVPPALRYRSWRAGVRAAFLAFAGIFLPLLAFAGAGFLTPDAKSNCRFGWIDCFHVGKFVLTPLVFWAVAAFYTLVVWRTARFDRAWIRRGLVQGAIVSGVCVLHGLVTFSRHTEIHFLLFLLFLSIPAYTCAWYGRLAWRVSRPAPEPPLTPMDVAVLVASGTPLWLLSAAASWWAYRGLPQHPSSCFVVTAAARGHRRVVGPLLQIARDGAPRQVTTQLLTFWVFEAVWQARAPQSHRVFRRFYNVWGCRAARLIRNPWTADAAYLLLKPAEIVAQRVARGGGRQE